MKLNSAAVRQNLRRYSRHLLIPEVGLAGQVRLVAARVLVVGAGGLGSPVLQYLAAAGIGRIGIVDDDRVDITNLQRQVIFTTDDIGAPKAQAAAARLGALNPEIAFDAYDVRLGAANARDLVRPYDVIVDATDTFETRYVLSDAARLEAKPLVYGSIFRFDGQLSVFAPGGPCYRCLFPQPPPAGSVPTCAEGGVLGVLPGMIGTWQAAEVLKLVLGIGRPLVGRLVLVDALDAIVREVAIATDPACPLHGDHPTIFDVRDLATPAPPELAPGIGELPADELDAFLAGRPDARVLDVREAHEIALGPAPRAVHVPASELAARLHELDSARTYVVACRLGARSQGAAGLLYDAGFRRLRHLSGGLLRYAATHAEFEIF